MARRRPLVTWVTLLALVVGLGLTLGLAIAALLAWVAHRAAG